MSHDLGCHRGRQRYEYLRRDFFPRWRDFICTVLFYATWDDHGYCGQDTSG